MKHELIPLSQGLLMVNGQSDFRIEFLKVDEKVIGLNGLYDNGNSEKNTKDEKP